MNAPSVRTGNPWRRMLNALLSRPTRGQLVVALLCGLLGFGLVTQVHATSSTGGLGAARVDDLLGILSDLNSRGDRLRAEISDLEASQQRLRSGAGQDQAALREARARVNTLGILTGTLAAKGTGVVVTVSDPQGSVRAAVLLDAVEELRDAGAEAIELNNTVRVVASTSILDRDGVLVVDGTELHPPYVIDAIGSPHTLAEAVVFPGGLSDEVKSVGGSTAVKQAQVVTAASLHTVAPPEYSQPTTR